MHTPQSQDSSLGILDDPGLFTETVSPERQPVRREQHDDRPEEELMVGQHFSGGGTGTIRHARVAGQANQRQTVGSELRPGKSGMGGYAGRRAAGRAGRWSGRSGTGAEVLGAPGLALALILRRGLQLVVAAVILGRRVLLRAGRAAEARRPHVDVPLGRVAGALDICDGAAVAGRLALVALDAAGPARQAASARASLDLAHGQGQEQDSSWLRHVSEDALEFGACLPCLEPSELSAATCVH